MSVERRLVEALAEFERVEPSPDLFARLEQSLAADRAHRRRVFRWTTAGVGGVLAVTATVVALATRAPTGSLIAPAWGVRLVELAVLVALIVALGPAIRRFGAIYVTEVFRISPETGRRFLALLDVAYYLVFVGYALVGVVLRDAGRMLRLDVLLRTMLDRVGGLLLLMGLLHAATIVVLPLIGLLHASVVRRHRRAALRSAAPPPSPRAEQAERVVRIVLWLAAAYVLVQVLVGLGVVLGIGIAG
jgi:FtsH-binding integral membrane protein